MAKKKEEKKAPEEIQFEADKEVYQFNLPQIKVNLGSGYETLTAEECLKRDEVLAHLVSIGSGAIKKVKGGK